MSLHLKTQSELCNRPFGKLGLDLRTLFCLLWFLRKILDWLKKTPQNAYARELDFLLKDVKKRFYDNRTNWAW